MGNRDYDRGFEDGFMSGSCDGKDGCYIATCVYGSYDCPEVWTLRRFRDQRLRKSAAGRAFVRLYYAVSPGLVRRFGGVAWLRRLVRYPLGRLVKRLRSEGVSSEPYNDLGRSAKKETA